MISDKERRRAVAELREASTGAYRHVDALDVIAGSVGVEVDGKFGHEVENETYAALADFIDRPTCKNLSPKPADVLLCSECGEHVDIAYVESCDDYRAKYCPPLRRGGGRMTRDDLFEAERVTVGEVLGLCQNPAKNERGELAAAEVERARRALRTYVFGAGASERTGNSLRTGEGEDDGRR